MKKQFKKITTLALSALLAVQAPALGVSALDGLQIAMATERSAVIRGTTVNVRSGASTGSSKVAALDSNTAVTVIGEQRGADGYTWYQIRYNGGTGFVRSDYIKFPSTYQHDANFENQLNAQGFPESYKDGLRQLHAEYPNWTFTAFHTGLDWNTVLTEELKGSRSLVGKNSISSYKSIEDGKFDWNTSSWPGFDGSAWVAASAEITAYYLDPRNFLDETYIFQFESQKYNPAIHTADGLAKMLKGTFLDDTVMIPDPNGTLNADGSPYGSTGTTPGGTAGSGSAVQGSTGGPGGTADGSSTGNSSTATPDGVIGSGPVAGSQAAQESTQAAVQETGTQSGTETSTQAATGDSSASAESESLIDYSSPIAQAQDAAMLGADFTESDILDADALLAAYEAAQKTADTAESAAQTGAEEQRNAAELAKLDVIGPGGASAGSTSVSNAGPGGSGSSSGSSEGGSTGTPGAAAGGGPYRAATYAEIIMKAAQTSGVSPYVLASMILQEQGKGTSDLISGTHSQYPGIYNYFNIGAYAENGMSATQRGLWYASQEGSYGRPWNTIEKAIVHGAESYAAGYVNAGQDTFYLKKWNVQGSNMFKHQYMTNVEGGAAEGAKYGSAYTPEVRAQAHEFKIPVYTNMPANPCPKPTGDGNPNNKLKSICIDGFSYSPSFDKDTNAYTLIVDPSISSLNVSATALNSEASIAGTGNISLNDATTTVTITVTAGNGTKRQYTLTINKQAGGALPSGGTGANPGGALPSGGTGANPGGAAGTAGGSAPAGSTGGPGGSGTAGGNTAGGPGAGQSSAGSSTAGGSDVIVGVGPL